MYAPCEIAAPSTDEPEAPFAFIPLRRRGRLVAWALVDAENCERLGEGWFLRSDGYVVKNVPHPDGGTAASGDPRRTLLGLGRAVLGLRYGDRRQADHRDLDPLNNRKSNLRITTNAQNAQNRRPLGHRDSPSRYRGVSFRRDKWQARVVLDGHEHWLGVYADEDAAGAAVARFRREQMPYSTN